MGTAGSEGELVGLSCESPSILPKPHSPPLERYKGAKESCPGYQSCRNSLANLSILPTVALQCTGPLQRPLTPVPKCPGSVKAGSLSGMLHAEKFPLQKERIPQREELRWHYSGRRQAPLHRFCSTSWSMAMLGLVQRYNRMPHARPTV